jgi:hypothetical protein
MVYTTHILATDTRRVHVASVDPMVVELWSTVADL